MSKKTNNKLGRLGRAMMGILVATMFAVGCGGDMQSAEEPTVAPRIPTLDVVHQAERRGTFANLVAESGYGDVLAASKPVTVFAPSDAAFDMIPTPVLARLRSPSHRAMLALIVGHHIVDGRIDSPALAAEGPRVTKAGTALPFRLADHDDDDLVGGNAGVDYPDMVGTNGTVHGINAVLFPALSDLLKVYRDDARSFSMFYRAMEKTGALPALDDQACTVLAPDDATFAKLGQANVDALFADTARLSALVSAHIVDRVVFGDQLLGTFASRSGAEIRFNGTVDTLTVDAANGVQKVAITDLVSRSAVVHGIEGFLAAP